MPRPVGQGSCFSTKPLAFRQGVVHGPRAMRLPPFREGPQRTIAAGVLAWQAATAQMRLQPPTLQLRDSAGLRIRCMMQRTRHRLPPLGPAHPGVGAPRSAVFDYEKSIAQLLGSVKPHAQPRTSCSNRSKKAAMNE